MIDRLLIANRGEIACRIARTCRTLGIAVVCVFTEADANALWVREADRAFRIGSYLDVEGLVSVALRAGARAVHPGFGFLAENVAFARAVLAAGLIWVGPSPESMEALASKEGAKELAVRAEVPVLPNYTLENAEFPLMVKAVAGGGGKGMRRVDRREDLLAATQSAASEAARSFGDDRFILEPLLVQARHVEVQVLGDQHGTVIHLGERDCSLQRRHQKVMEECPAPDLPMRDQLHDASVRLARAAGYSNAGTGGELTLGEDITLNQLIVSSQAGAYTLAPSINGYSLIFAGTTPTLQNDSSESVTIQAGWQAASGLTKLGTGKIIFTAAAGSSTGSGTLAIQQGSVQLSAADTLPTNMAVILGDQNTAGSLEVDFDQTIASLSFQSRSSGVTNNVTIAEGATLTLNGSLIVGIVDGTSAGDTRRQA